jgi:putative heme-binding domain-containing protein
MDPEQPLNNDGAATTTAAADRSAPAEMDAGSTQGSDGLTEALKAERRRSNQLEKELLAVAPAELARVALTAGNIKNGKNLFYKSAAACATCHHPSSNGVRLGPALQELKTELSPAELVESVLYPSKLIDKAYAQVTVITADGRQATGMRISETADEIVLRNLAQSTPMAFRKTDVDEIFESPVSLMPEHLVRQLKNRQEFNDLMRYVLEVRKR